MPRRNAVLSGQVAEDRGSANGYVVFAKPESVGAALQANMKEVGTHGCGWAGAERCASVLHFTV